MTSRRDFIKYMGLLPMINIEFEKDLISKWKKIKKLYPASSNPILNLNTGSCGVMPTPVLEAYINAVQLMNQYAPYQYAEEWTPLRQQCKKRIANYLGCNETEIGIVRNTTEGILNILTGIPWQKGDEVIYMDAEYPNNLHVLQHLRESEGIMPRPFAVDINAMSDDDIVESFAQNLSSKTKLILVSLMTYREGQIMPVRRITELAHKNGTEVLVDAAHAFGQFAHNVQDLGCDYYASSLHKWLTAPQGTGIVYVRKDKLAQLNPINAHPLDMVDMEKMEYVGTHDFAKWVGIKSALDFLDVVNLEQKEQRLQELTQYWMDKLAHVEQVQLYNQYPHRIRGLGVFAIKNRKSHIVRKSLKEKYGLLVKQTRTPFQSKNAVLRLSSNLFVMEKDLDRVVDALIDIAKG